MLGVWGSTGAGGLGGRNLSDRGSGMEGKEVKPKEVRVGEVIRDGVGAGNGESLWSEVLEMLVRKRRLVFTTSEAEWV